MPAKCPCLLGSVMVDRRGCLFRALPIRLPLRKSIARPTESGREYSEGD